MIFSRHQLCRIFHMGNGEMRIMSRVLSQIPENSGSREFLLYEVLSANCTNDHTVNPSHLVDTEPTDIGGRPEVRLPYGRYACQRIHVYASAVKRKVHSDSRIMTGHPTVTVHVCETCYDMGNKVSPIAVFPTYGACPSIAELPNINHCIFWCWSHCITNYIPCPQHRSSGCILV